MSIPEKLNNYMPGYIRSVIGKLNEAGYEAYAVGGCVRDLLLGFAPHDWDICTSARPEQILTVFEDERTLLSGLKHGTVSVVKEGGLVEITAYRIDGSYLDGRHPDSVIFTDSLRDDLARRDFTINAMAMDTSGKVYDPWNGQADLKKRLIRCVGDPRKRFEEDALRILRALRFASVLGFDIEDNTSRAIISMKERLVYVSAERKREELFKLLCGKNPGSAAAYRDVIAQIISLPCCDEQAMYEDCLRIASLTESDIVTRIAVIFRGDDAKHCRSVLEQLRCDKKTIRDTTSVLECLSGKAPTDRHDLIEALYLNGDSEGRAIARHLDISHASGEITEAGYIKAKSNLNELLSDSSVCFSMSRLKINGDSLASLGISGKITGDILHQLIDETVYGKTENSEQALLRRASEIYGNKL